MSTRLIYLASPHSDPNPLVIEQRYQEAMEATARLLAAGHLVYSPIVYTHPMFLRHLPDWNSFEHWKNYDSAMLFRCQELWVLTLDGWEFSLGITAEVELANRSLIPIHYISLAECLSSQPHHS